MPAAVTVLLALSLLVLPQIRLPEIPLPTQTPIPCLVCQVAKADEFAFAGFVQIASPGRIGVFNEKTQVSMMFVLPPDFSGVDSSDGVIKNGPITRATPGLLTRVSYHSASDRAVVTQVLLLTISQCRALMNAERINHTPLVCPD